MSAVPGRIAESFTSSARTLLRETEDLAFRCRLDPAADLGIGRHHLPEASTLSLDLYRSAQQELRGRCEDALAAGRYQSAMARPRGAGRARRAARERLDQELAIIART